MDTAYPKCSLLLPFPSFFQFKRNQKNVCKGMNTNKIIRGPLEKVASVSQVPRHTGHQFTRPQKSEWFPTCSWPTPCTLVPRVALFTFLPCVGSEGPTHMTVLLSLDHPAEPGGPTWVVSPRCLLMPRVCLRWQIPHNHSTLKDALSRITTHMDTFFWAPSNYLDKVLSSGANRKTATGGKVFVFFINLPCRPGDLLLLPAKDFLV